MTQSDEIATIERIGTGLYGVTGPHGRQLWTSCTTRKKAGTKCALCRQEVDKNVAAIRPVGNAANRYRRIHEACALKYISKGRTNGLPEMRRAGV